MPRANSTNKLTEWYLQGASTLAREPPLGLGSAYNETLDATDLIFKYTSETGTVITAPVVFGTIHRRALQSRLTSTAWASSTAP